MEEGDMARTLCVNLLGELVKGSFQFFKNNAPNLQSNAKNEALEKFNDLKTHSKSLKMLIDDSKPHSSRDISESNELKEAEITAAECKEDTTKKRKFTETVPPQTNSGFKKAKYSWQIKGRRNSGEAIPETDCVDESSESSESEDSSDVSDADTSQCLACQQHQTQVNNLHKYKYTCLEIYNISRTFIYRTII
jgi:hypothetical protein